MEFIKGDALDFSSVERGIGFELHPSVKGFYTSAYRDDIPVIYKGIKLSLVQVCSANDFIRLQENILGHLVMLQRLKLTPTIFIATLKDENKIISIDNNSGEVICEFLGTEKRVVLEPSLDDFLAKVVVNS